MFGFITGGDHELCIVDCHDVGNGAYIDDVGNGAYIDVVVEPEADEINPVFNGL